MLSNEEMIDSLSSLVKLDVDAVRAYGQAIGIVDVMSIRDQLRRFQGDHRRHIDDLSAMIRDLGGTPPSTPNGKGFFNEGFTIVSSQAGTEGALRVMQTNERLTTKAYTDATEWELSAGPAALVRTSLEDERRHLHYIQQALADKGWTQPDWQPRAGEHPRPEQRPGAA